MAKKKNPKVELKPYSTSRNVKASKISSIVKGREGSASIVVESEEKDVDNLVVEVDRHFMAKYSPRSGGYLVSETIDKKDVYSFISADVFENTFTPVTETE